VSVDPLPVRDAGLLERLERRAPEWAPPRTGCIRGRVEIYGVVLQPRRGVIEEKLLRDCDRGHGRSSRQVPHQDECAARSENACDLRQGALVVEPLECFRGENCINGRVRERDRFRAACQHLDLWAEASEKRTHALIRLQSNSACESRNKEPRQLARTSAQFKDRRRRWESDDVKHLRRPAWAPALVVVMPMARRRYGEHARRSTPPARLGPKVNNECRASGAISARWPTCVR